MKQFADSRLKNLVLNAAWIELDDGNENGNSYIAPFGISDEQITLIKSVVTVDSAVDKPEETGKLRPMIFSAQMASGALFAASCLAEIALGSWH